MPCYLAPATRKRKRGQVGRVKPARAAGAVAAVALAGSLLLRRNPAVPAVPSPPAPPRAASHCAGLAGVTSRALLERPIPLREDVGRLHQAVSTRSTEAQAYYDQGLAYLASFSFVDASRSLHEALRRDPALAMAHRGLGMALLALEARADARQALNRATALVRSQSVAPREARWIGLAVQQLDAVEAAEADRPARHEAYKRALEGLIELDPTDAHAWVLRGNAEEPFAEGRGQSGGLEAIEFYTKALERDPGHLGAHHFLIHSHENAGQPQRALPHARRFAEVAGGVPHARHMLGHVLARLGRWQEAREEFAAAHERHRSWFAGEKAAHEDDWHYAHNLHLFSAVLLRLGDDAAAEPLLRELYGLEPRNLASALYAAPWLEHLVLRGRFEDAVAAARTGESSPSLARRTIAAALAAEALLAAGRVGEAWEASQRALDAYGRLATEARGGPDQPIMPALRLTLVEPLVAQLELLGDQRGQGVARLIRLGDVLGADPTIDAWADNRPRLQRLVLAARRAQLPEVEKALAARVQRIDSAAPVPGL